MQNLCAVIWQPVRVSREQAALCSAAVPGSHGREVQPSRGWCCPQDNNPKQFVPPFPPLQLHITCDRSEEGKGEQGGQLYPSAYRCEAVWWSVLSRVLPSHGLRYLRQRGYVLLPWGNFPHTPRPQSALLQGGCDTVMGNKLQHTCAAL